MNVTTTINGGSGTISNSNIYILEALKDKKLELLPLIVKLDGLLRESMRAQNQLSFSDWQNLILITKKICRKNFPVVDGSFRRAVRVPTSGGGGG